MTGGAYRAARSADGGKPLFVLRMVRAEQSIPEVEIQSVVCPEAFVMHGMVRGRVQELSHPGAEKPARKDLEPAMSEHVERDLPGHEDEEGRRMHRNGEGRQ